MIPELVLVALLAVAQPQSQPPSSAASSDSMICLTESEWEAMGAETQRILEETVVEAVNEAVKPYTIQVKIMEKEIFWWKVGFWSAVAATAGSLIWAATR